MATGDVSVVIPALNEADNIVRAVESAHTAGAGEVIVVDGGSHDETVWLAEQHGAKIIVSQSGRAVQQNAGAADATGAALLFLHADNWLTAHSIEQIVNAMANPSVLAGAFRQRIEAGGWGYRWLERGNALRATVVGLPYGDQGLFIRRQTFEQLGGFPDARLMEDMMLMKRLRRISRPILLPGPLHVSPRRWQRHGLVRQTMRNWFLLTAHSCGVSANRLAQFYPAHRSSK